MIEDLEERIEGLTIMDDYDDCIAGLVRMFGKEEIVAYDYDKIIQRHIGDGMTHEEAVEFFEFNQIGAYVGERTPCFIEFIHKEMKKTEEEIREEKLTEVGEWLAEKVRELESLFPKKNHEKDTDPIIHTYKGDLQWD